MVSDSYQVLVSDVWAVSLHFSYSRIDADFIQGNYPSDLEQLPTVLEPSLTSLSATERDTCAMVVDGILEEHGEGVPSGVDILEILRARSSVALTRQRHLLKMLIIQRLKLQPTPQTVILNHAGGDDGESSMAAAVFNVPELLESILSHLTMPDLVVARRVNKALFRLTETSPTLQRKLMLLPSNSPPDYLACPHNGSPDKFVIPPGEISQEVLWGTSHILASMNPFLTRFQSHGWTCISSPDEGLFGPFRLLDSAKIKTQIFNSKVRPEMYLTCPPCTGVIIRFRYIEDSRSDQIIRLAVARTVYDPAGVTFATLWDALRKEGEVVVCRDYKPASEANSDFQSIIHTTVSQQIDLHRRKGIEISLDEEHSVVEAFSVAVRATDAEGGGLDCGDNGGRQRVQDIEW
jgi:hypothetical protein